VSTDSSFLDVRRRPIVRAGASLTCELWSPGAALRARGSSRSDDEALELVLSCACALDGGRLFSLSSCFLLAVDLVVGMACTNASRKGSYFPATVRRRCFHSGLTQHMVHAACDVNALWCRASPDSRASAESSERLAYPSCALDINGDLAGRLGRRAAVDAYEKVVRTAASHAKLQKTASANPRDA